MSWRRDPDARALALWIGAGVLALAIGVRFFFVAFPEASLDFRVGSGEATSIAREFLRARGADVAGHTSTVVMKADNDAKIYLEREVGLERANVLMASEVTVFAFEVRFFRDLEREEHLVRVDPSGRVVGLAHVMEEARPGARLDALAARAIAEAFLKAVEPRASEYVFLEQEQSSVDRPARRDWSFSWERRGFRAADAPYRITVSVNGDAASGFAPALKVPDAWKRDFERLRSENAFYQSLATVGFVLVLGLILATLIRYARRGVVRWKDAGVLGGALWLVLTAMSLNALPLALSGYATTQSFAGYVATQVVVAVVSSALLAVVIALTFAAAEPLYRERWPERLRLAVVLHPRALATREMFRGLVLGLALAAVMFGGQILFYVLGRGLGVWAPQDVRYTDAVTTLAPWLFPLGISIQAALLEEGMFRLFAIPLLLAWTRSRLLAVLVPAVIWGFGHSSYPVEPGYVRGIEVGLIGVMFGLVFLRWGLVPVVVAHYTFDAALIATFLLRSSDLGFRISGAVVGFVLVLPLAAAVVLLLTRRGFRDDTALVNRAQTFAPAAPAAETAEVTGVYEPASGRRLRLALAAGVTGLLLFIVVKPPEAIGSYVQVPIAPRDAERTADGLLTRAGIDIARLQRVATLGGAPPLASAAASDAPIPPDPQPFDPYVNEYLRQQLGIPGANRLLEQHAPSVFWRVRYFQDGVKDERTVLLRTDGSPYAILRTRAEADPGPDLAQADARAVAERYLRSAQGLDLGAWRAVDATSRKLPRRTDHTFVYERLEAVGEAHVRAEVAVSGDEVSAYRTFVKIPEAWQRSRSEVTLVQTALRTARGLVLGGAAIALLVVVLRAIRRRPVPWRPLSVLALGVGALNLAGAINGLPDLVARYPTALPFAQYLAGTLTSALIGATLFGAAALIAAAAAWLLAERAFGSERLPTLAPAPAFWRDALILGLAGAGAYLLWLRIPTIADVLWPVERAGLAAQWPSNTDVLSPAVHVLGISASAGILMPTLALAAASAAAIYLRRWWLLSAAAVLTAFAFAPDPWTLEQTARDVTVALVQLAVVAVWVTRVARWSVLSYLIAIPLAMYVRAGIELVLKGNAYFVGNGIALLVLSAVLLALPVIAWRRSHRADHDATFEPAPTG